MSRRVVLPLLIAPLVLLAPAVLTGKTLFWGTVSLQFAPWRWFAWEVIRSGDLPLWNPLSGMGAPLLANYQSGLLYPPNWLLFALSGLGGIGWAAWGLGVLVFLHLAWAGIGMAYLARQLGLKELGQVVAGLAFGLSAYMVGRAGFLSMNSAAAWLPWLLALAFDIQNTVKDQREGGKNRLEIAFRLGGLALCLALQLLAGHAQITWYSWVLLGIWTVYWGWKGAHSHHSEGLSFPKIKIKIQEAWKALVRLALAIVFAGGLAAAQLWPTAEYLVVSQRSSEVGYEFAATYSFWPWRFLTMVAPDLYGNPVRGDYWGYGNYWEDALYIGLLPLLLGLGLLLRAVFTRNSNRQNSGMQADGREVSPNPADGISYTNTIPWLLLGLILMAFVLALGKNTPVFSWLYHHVPTFDLFQGPTRWTIWVEFALALLAGFGVDAWRRPEKRGLYWSRLALAGTLAVTFGAGLAWYALREINPTFLRAVALAGVWGFGCGALNLLAPEKPAGTLGAGNGRSFNRWSWALIIFVAADLLVAGWGLNPVQGREFYTFTNSTFDNLLADLDGKRLYLPAEDEYDLKFDRFMQFRTYDPGEDWLNLRRAMLPNSNLLEGIASVNNFDPLLPGRYERWMSALEQQNAQDQAVLLNLMAVGVVEHIDSTANMGVRFDPIPDGERLGWVPCALYVDGEEEALDLVFAGQTDFSQVVILEQPSTRAEKDCTPSPEKGQIRIQTESNNRLMVEVETPAPGWLHMADTWYPGWVARIDGVPVEILRANYLFRAVPVEAGKHMVEFEYQSVSFGGGMVVAIIAWGILGITLFLGNRNRIGENRNG